jgi:hypothetical protein
MFKERRAAARFNFNRYARIQAEMAGVSRDCLIVDMSTTGVRLHAEVGEIPADFTLIIADAKPPRRACQIVWRLGYEIGAKFIDADRAAVPRSPRPAA